ncbi:MAG: DUF3467 domain-containing protein [Anaerolineales bacterium]|jgi:hypothetical protein|nr:DUF3467 domain-containing protein [Anaerolineales bacterium]
MTNQPSQPNRPAAAGPVIEVPAETSTVYANLVRIAHSPSDLVFDFAHLMPGVTPARVQARVVMSPLGAKLFQRALAENLARYEAAFGEIKIPGESTLADSLFRPPHPPTPNREE